ncbi:hypothetical protein ACWGJ9_09980 [Curtobacterium citreum]
MKTSRIALAATIAATAAVLLTACGGPHSGQVHDKDHRDGYYSPSQVCTMYNTDGSCKMTTQQMHWVQPTWSLDIYNGDQHGWVSVTEARYNSVEIGDYVNLDG